MLTSFSGRLQVSQKLRGFTYLAEYLCMTSRPGFLHSPTENPQSHIGENLRPIPFLWIWFHCNDNVQQNTRNI